MTDTYIKELYKATGGPWGGTRVDQAFERLLATIIGDEVYNIFKQQCAYDHLELFRNFESTKKSIKPNEDLESVVRLPMCLVQIHERETGQKIKERIAASAYKDSIKVIWDRMILSADLSRSFFKEVNNEIVEHLTGLLKKPELQGTDTLLLVGGFADSAMLRHAIRSNFVDKGYKVFTPDNAELVIVQGSVFFGFKPQSVQVRFAPYTYGVKAVRDFLTDVHDATKCGKFPQKGVYKCSNLFVKFVEIGTGIRYGEVQGEHEFMPLTEEARKVSVFVYACTERFPEYVTDEGCEKRAKVELELLENKVPLEERIITISFMFSDSEITVTAKEKMSGNKVEAILDFQ